MELDESKFVEFLVDKGIIKKEIILELQIQQYLKIPSTIQLVVNRKLLPIYKIFKTFEKLSEFGFDFERTARELNFWTPEIQQKVEEEKSLYKLTIGQILVGKKITTTREMVDLMEEFTGVKIDAISTRDMILEDTQEEEFKVNFMPIDIDILDDYLLTVDVEKRLEIEKLILDWEKLPMDRSQEKVMRENVHAVKREYHTIKGSSRFINAALIEKITHHAEDLIDVFEENFYEVDEKTKGDLTSLNLKILDLMWDILENLQKSKSEEPYWEVEENRQNIIKIVKEISRLKNIITPI